MPRDDGAPGGAQVSHPARRPLLCPLCQGRPRPWSSRVPLAGVFLRISCLLCHGHAVVIFIDSPLRDNYLFGPCIHKFYEHVGAFPRETANVFGQLTHERAGWPALRRG